MNNNKYVSKARLLAHQRRRKAQTISNIEARKLKQVNANLRIRYVGLVLVQGSSGLALMGYPLMTYWVALWFGLLCYQITAINFFNEDNRVYKMTQIKYKNNLGSSLETVNALKVKKNREMVYIIGNTIGLVLIGANILFT